MNDNQRQEFYNNSTEDERLSYALRLANNVDYLEAKKDEWLPYYKLSQLIETFKTSVLNATLALSDIDAMQWFSQNWPYGYFTEYFNAFEKLQSRALNQIIANRQNTFNRRSDVTNATTQLQGLSILGKVAFSWMFSWMRANKRDSLPALLQSYFKKVVRNDTALFNSSYSLAQKSYNLLNNNPNSAEGIVGFRSDLQHEVMKAFSYGLYNAGTNDNATLVQFLNIIEAISWGPIFGLKKGVRSIYLSDTPLYNANGEKLLNSVQTDFKLGYRLQPVSLLSKFPSVSEKVNKELKFGEPVSQTVNFVNCDALQVTLSSNALHGDNYTYLEMSRRVTIQATHKETGELAPKRTVVTGNIGGIWESYKEFNHLITLEPFETFPVTITAERLDYIAEEDTSNKRTQLSFQRVTGISEIAQSWPSIAYNSLLIKHDNAEQAAKRTYHVLGKVVSIPDNYDPFQRTYKGIWTGSFKTGWTNNPIWIILDILINRDYGAGKEINFRDIDIYSFYKAAKYCDEDVNGRPRWTCNAIIDTSKNLRQTIASIADNVRATLIGNKQGKLSIIIDQPTEPVYLFTNANVINGKFKRSGMNLNARAKRISVNFINSDKNYIKDTLHVDDYQNQQDLRKVKNVNALGCTRYEQAKQLGKFILDVEKNETHTLTFTTSLEGSIIEVGDVISVADSQTSGVNSSGMFKRIDYEVSGNNNVYSCLLDHLDEYFYTNLSNLFIEYNSDGERYITQNVTIEQIGEDWWLKLVNPEVIPVVNNTFTIYTTNFSPELYKVTEVNYDDYTIGIKAQKYSTSKYYFSEHEDDTVTTTSTSVTPFEYSAEISNLREVNKGHNGKDCYVDIMWDLPPNAYNLACDVFVIDKATNQVIKEYQNVSSNMLRIEGEFMFPYTSYDLDFSQSNHADQRVIKNFRVEVHPKINGVFLNANKFKLDISSRWEDYAPSGGLTITHTSVRDSETESDTFILKISWQLNSNVNPENLSGFRIYIAKDKARVTGTPSIPAKYTIDDSNIRDVNIAFKWPHTYEALSGYRRYLGEKEAGYSYRAWDAYIQVIGYDAVAGFDFRDLPEPARLLANDFLDLRASKVEINKQDINNWRVIIDPARKPDSLSKHFLQMEIMYWANGRVDTTLANKFFRSNNFLINDGDHTKSQIVEFTSDKLGNWLRERNYSNLWLTYLSPVYGTSYNELYKENANKLITFSNYRRGERVVATKIGRGVILQYTDDEISTEDPVWTSNTCILDKFTFKVNGEVILDHVDQFGTALNQLSGEVQYEVIRHSLLGQDKSFTGTINIDAVEFEPDALHQFYKATIVTWNHSSGDAIDKLPAVMSIEPDGESSAMTYWSFERMGYKGNSSPSYENHFSKWGWESWEDKANQVKYFDREPLTSWINHTWYKDLKLGAVVKKFPGDESLNWLGKTWPRFKIQVKAETNTGDVIKVRVMVVRNHRAVNYDGGIYKENLSFLYNIRTTQEIDLKPNEITEFIHQIPDIRPYQRNETRDDMVIIFSCSRYDNPNVEYFKISNVKISYDISMEEEVGEKEVDESGQLSFKPTKDFYDISDVEVNSLTPGTVAYPVWEERFKDANRHKDRETIQDITIIVQSLRDGSPASARVKYKIKGIGK